eukprot:jgi/Undpi1/13556/HiC_scaffold_8.g03215.m1
MDETVVAAANAAVTVAAPATSAASESEGKTEGAPEKGSSDQTEIAAAQQCQKIEPRDETVAAAAVETSGASESGGMSAGEASKDSNVQMAIAETNRGSKLVCKDEKVASALAATAAAVSEKTEEDASAVVESRRDKPVAVTLGGETAAGSAETASICEVEKQGAVDDLHPVILEVFRRHTDMGELSPDEVSAYVDTVLAVVFYRISRCGVIVPAELRCSGFIKEFDAVGRMTKSLEDSEYFSFSRHDHLRSEYFRLCGRGWSVGKMALRFYRHGDGSAVGAVRAERVINAGLRPFPRHQHTGSSAIKNMPGMPGGYGQPLDYEAWVCFFLCEEAVRGARKWSKRDVSYCFDLVDQTGGGRIGMADFTQQFQDVFWDSISFGESHDDDWPTIQEVVSRHLDSLGVERGRNDVTLKELVKPGNVVRAGRFFAELFTGTAPRERGYHSDNDDSNDGDDSDDPADSTEEEAGEEDCEGTDGEDEDQTSVDATGDEGQQHPPPPPPAAAAVVAEPCPVPVSPIQQQHQQHQQHHQRQGSVVYLENHHGTYYPAPAPPLQQQQPMQPWAVGHEEEGVSNACYTSSPNQPPPGPLPCGENFAGMHPPQVLPMQQYPPSPPPTAYGGHMYPIEAPRGPSFNAVCAGNLEGGMFPPGGAQWRQPFFTCSEGHLSGAVYGQAPTAYEGGCHFGGTVYSQDPVACHGGC